MQFFYYKKKKILFNFVLLNFSNLKNKFKINSNKKNINKNLKIIISIIKI